jgi:hypothetical protein
VEPLQGQLEGGAAADAAVAETAMYRYWQLVSPKFSLRRLDRQVAEAYAGLLLAFVARQGTHSPAVQPLPHLSI